MRRASLEQRIRDVQRGARPAAQRSTDTPASDAQLTTTQLTTVWGQRRARASG
eukprot:SAG25_NODE_2150_length_1893_cov_1.896321_5_plen_52_part_01